MDNRSITSGHNGISVILATYNGEKFISKQLNSILQQDVAVDEIIICDDCSTDGTVQILQSYLNDNRIKLYINNERLGVFGNFRKAAKMAVCGNWLIFSDQDDIWVPNKISTLTRRMIGFDDKVTPVLLFSDLKVIDTDDEVVAQSFWKRQKIYPKQISLKSLLYGNIVTGCSIMINYAMAKELLAIESCQYLHDEWLALIAYSFGKVQFVDEQLVLYRQHEQNITYAKDASADGLMSRLNYDLTHLLRKKKFLERQFNMVNEFLSVYREKLNDKQIKVLTAFLKLENSGYLIKRINRFISFY